MAHCRRRSLYTLLALCTACGQEGVARSGAVAGTLTAVWDTSRGMRAALVTIRGLSASELQLLRADGRDAATRDSMSRAFVQLSVANENSTTGDLTRTLVPIAGTLVVDDLVAHFAPRFAFDAGRQYLAMLHPSAVGRADTSTILQALALPAVTHAAVTEVTGIYPSGDTIPENALRFYIAFSAPMSREGGLSHISLRDARGNEIRNAFLPLEADFWNGDRTRYTAFLDPGRVKQGILPNEQMGRPLHAGERVMLRVDATWRDQFGVPLRRTFEKTYRVGKADQQPITLQSWHVSEPRAGTREPLIVTFAKPLDHGLLLRALGVESPRGDALRGDVTIAQHERAWSFVPAAAWVAGTHQLLVLSILEDMVGNQIGKPFEVDMFTRVDSTSAPEQRRIAFTVR